MLIYGWAWLLERLLSSMAGRMDRRWCHRQASPTASLSHQTSCFVNPEGSYIMTLYRQGDILILATHTIPERLKPVAREHGRIVLAHGEVTGHCHAIDSDTAVFLETDLAEMADRFLRVEEEVQVVHDEHDAITLPPGDYIVRRQREYSPEAIRRVVD